MPFFQYLSAFNFNFIFMLFFSDWKQTNMDEYAKIVT